jgi:tRNA modification GTPase
VKAAIAVFRLSGPHVEQVSSLILNKKLEPRKLELVKVRRPDNGDVIDLCLAAWFPRPASFTGEDVLELHTHGSLAISRELLGLFSTLPGLRLAEPGEFSKRAFENGKLDLSSAEALSDLIHADTQHQRRLAIHRILGGFSDQLESWRRELIHIRALLEASLDFSDEGDLSSDLEEEVLSKLEILATDVSETILRSERYQYGREGYQVLVAGPPNAGKSSLVNALANKRIAIVSDVPGTTRDLIEAKLEIGGYPVVLIDCAGLRNSEDQIETIGMELAREKARNVDLVLWLGEPSDGLREFGKLECDLFNISAKCDLHPKSSASLNVSSFTGEGLDDLLVVLAEKAKFRLGEYESGAVLHARQLQSATNFELEVNSAISSIRAHSPEICAVHLDKGALSLGGVVNDISHADLLDEIFSRFCLGK